MESASRVAEQTLAIAKEFNAAGREGLALIILSLIAAIAGNDSSAQQLGERSLPLPVGRYFRSYSDWGSAITYRGLGNTELAWRQLQASHRSVQVPASIPRLLTVAAVLLGQQGDLEQAAELLGAVYSSRYSAHGWMEQWRPLTELRARLRSELGPARFQELRDRGGHLDAERLADELLGAPAGPERAV
jgi:hypothetical protein